VFARKTQRINKLFSRITKKLKKNEKKKFWKKTKNSLNLRRNKLERRGLPLWGDLQSLPVRKLLSREGTLKFQRLKMFLLKQISPHNFIIQLKTLK